MTELGGYMGKVLKINLSTKEISEYPWSDNDRREFLGGKIMAAKIISDIVSNVTQAFDEDNVIVISTGPLSLTGAPASNRFNVSSISPITNHLVSSSCGGNFGLTLKKAGLDALVITGIAKIPIWIEINDDIIEFHEATDLWGASTTTALEKLSEYSKTSGKLVIGPAGENLVRYAELFSHDRSTGRGGFGAVFGAKNLKAITTIGTKSPKIISEDKFKKLNLNWLSELKTNSNNAGCITCPIQCNRILSYRGKVIKAKVLDKLKLLGSYIEITDLDALIIWKEIADEMGLDTISLVDVLMCRVESNKFRSVESISQLIKDIGLTNDNKEILKPIKQGKIKEIDFLKESSSATGICLFILKDQHEVELRKLLNFVTGMNLSLKEFNLIGESGYYLAKDYNKGRVLE